MKSGKKNLTVLFPLIFILFSSNNFAQDSSKSIVNFDLGADFVSRYVWRGCELDPFPHIEPYATIDLSLSDQFNLNFGVYSSYGFTGEYAENDFIFELGYESDFGTLTVKVADYFFPYLNIPFTNFTNDSTGAHTVETSLAYTGTESFPVRFLVSQNVHGYDPDIHSLYLEAGFFTCINDIDIDVFIGTAKGYSVWHSVNTDKLEIVNTGVSLQKSIKVTDDLSIPTGVSFVYNPHLKNSFVILTLSI